MPDCQQFCALDFHFCPSFLFHVVVGCMGKRGGGGVGGGGRAEEGPLRALFLVCRKY